MATFLNARIGDRDNNLNLIRIIAALCVVVSHSYPLTIGPGAIEPLERLTGEPLGFHAVVVFFVISGLLIARSFERSDTLMRWTSARVLRLFPGLLFALALTAFVLGPLVTSLTADGYFGSAATWTYVPRNLLLFDLQMNLPGVFAKNSYPVVTNGSLWTLFYEVLCYGGVFLAGICGLLSRRKLFGALMLLVFVPIYVAEPLYADMLSQRILRILQLSYPFALGMTVYVYRDFVRLDWRIMAALWLAAILLAKTPFYELIFVAALGYTVLWLAFVPKGFVLNYNRAGDYSYGTYIYAFPVQQLFAMLLPDAGHVINMVLSVPVTVMLAALSWHLIEKPSLRFVRGKRITKPAPIIGVSTPSFGN